MASEIEAPVYPSGGDTVPIKKPCVNVTKSANPTLDEEGNVLPYPGYDSKAAGEKYCRLSRIARLAMAADLKKPIPTAGWYGIEHSKEPVVDIPPESYLYDEDRPWVLCKLNKKALSVPEPAEPVVLSKQTTELLNKMEAAANIDWAIRQGLEVSEKDRSTVSQEAQFHQAVVQDEEKLDAHKKENTTTVKGPVTRNTSVSPGRVSKSTSTGSPRTARAAAGQTPRFPSKSPCRSGDIRASPVSKKTTSPSPRPTSKVANAKQK